MKVIFHSNGFVRAYLRNSEQEEQAINNGYNLYDCPSEVDKVTKFPFLENGEVAVLDLDQLKAKQVELKELADSRYINNFRDKLINDRILINGDWFNANLKSREALISAISAFDAIKDANNKVNWILYDNTVKGFTKEELKAIHDKIVLRGSKVYIQAEIFKATEGITKATVNDISNWNIT